MSAAIGSSEPALRLPSSARLSTLYSTLRASPPFAMPVMNVESEASESRTSKGNAAEVYTGVLCCAQSGGGRNGRVALHAVERRVGVTPTDSDCAPGVAVRAVHCAPVRVKRAV